MLTRLASLHDDLAQHRHEFADFSLAQRSLISKLAAARDRFVAQIGFMKESHAKTTQELNQIITRRTNALARCEAELHARVDTAEKLQAYLHELSSSLKTVTIERDSVGDEVNVLKAHERAQSAHIDQLLDLLVEKPEIRQLDSPLSGSFITERHSHSMVPPFVIYSSSLQMPRKGFSLMPRNTLVFEAPAIEKVRVRIGGPASKPSPKLVVPKVSTQTLGSDGTQLPPTRRQIPSLDIDFDRLVPISSDDTTGSLIAYVTRYVNERSPEARAVTPGKFPLSPSPVLISEVPADRLRLEPPRTSVVRPQTAKTDKKMRRLEKVLQDAETDLGAEREKAQNGTRQVLVLTGQLERAERKAQANALLHEAAKKRLKQALALLANADREVLRLRRLVQEAQLLSARKILSTAHESDDLFTAFRRVSSGLGEMAVHELEAARRWEAKRERYLEEERVKLLAALDAMQFLTQMSKPEVRESMIISSAKRQRRRPPSPVADEHWPTPEQAIVTATASVQSLPEALRRGVVAS
jgi:hypothetical protein